MCPVYVLPISLVYTMTPSSPLTGEGWGEGDSPSTG